MATVHYCDSCGKHIKNIRGTAYPFTLSIDPDLYPSPRDKCGWWGYFCTACTEAIINKMNKVRARHGLELHELPSEEDFIGVKRGEHDEMEEEMGRV